MATAIKGATVAQEAELIIDLINATAKRRQQAEEEIRQNICKMAEKAKSDYEKYKTAKQEAEFEKEENRKLQNRPK